MAYTPYNQALPDTTLYERLKGSYTPTASVPNPYDVSLFNTDYYKDPFGYTKKKLGFGPTLDETLKKEGPQLNMGGLFAPQASSGGDSSNQENQRNYYQEIEDKFYNENLALGADKETARALAAQQAFEIQSANNARINAGLTLFGNALIPGMGAAGLAKYGPTGYADYIQGNARVMMGDKSGYTSPDYKPKPAGVAAPVVTASTGWNPEGTSYTSSYGTTTDSGSISAAEAAGLGAAQSSYGYGSNADYYGD